MSHVSCLLVFLSSLRMNTCFTSSVPAAVNASLMFDDNDDKGNLWTRSSVDVPLPSCSSSSPPPDSKCLVCLDRVVHAVCRNLMDGAEVMMEAGERPVTISESGEKFD